MERVLRSILLAFSALVLSATAYADVVSETEAQEVATTFFRSHDVEAVAVNELKEAWSSFYVFTPEAHKGFVIVSADDCTLPVLGFSLDQEFAWSEELPCNLRWWCEAMDNEIAQLRESGKVSARKRNDGTQTLATDELYLETPSWNQSAPYYNDCPTYDGTHCLTGCGPTALSEVMRYHNYPDRGIGKTDAYTVDKNNIYVASRNLEHDYDWDNMLYEYGDNYSDAEASAVATLMADVGAACSATYGTDATGVSTNPKLLAQIYTHFGYSSSMRHTYASTYDDDEWTALMKEQIATYGPMPYTGYSDAGGGHMFVIDGYDSGSYFHINWGWGGSSNGYFLLPSMDYCNNQAGVFNFTPDDGSPATCTVEVYGDGISSSTTTYQTGKKFTLSVTGMYNCSLIDFYGTFAFVLVDKDDNIKQTLATTTYNGLRPNYYLKWNNASCTISETLDDTDCIRLAYKETSDSEWHLMRPHAAGTVYKIHVTSSDYNVTMGSPGLSADTDTFYSDITFTTVAYPTNSSEVDIDNCYFRFVLTDSSGNVKETISHDFSFSNFSAGTTRSTSDVACSISTDLSAGDRIRLLYQATTMDDNAWQVVTTDAEDIPWEIVLTDDMIETREYTILMYTPGLSTNTTVFVPNESFIANGYPLNRSGYTIARSNFAFALTDGEGNVKELISSTYYVTNFQTGYYAKLEDRECTITKDIEVGDWICLVYQNNHTDADGWKVAEPYSNSTPWRIVITKDNLEQPDEPDPEEEEHALALCSSGLSVSTDVFYEGVEFTADAYLYNPSSETVSTAMRFALTDSEGERKEWLSRDKLIGGFGAERTRQITNVACSMATEPMAGNRIRLFYQGTYGDEDSWLLMEPYTSDVPWEVEITEDMITPTGISSVSANPTEVEGIYSTSGQKLNTAAKGVNIIRYADGTVRKLYVK